MNKLGEKSLLLLRISLGIVFLWFGILKLFTTGDGLTMLQQALPTSLAFSQLFSFFIAFLEIVIGIAFLAGRLVRTVSVVSFAYLLATAVLIVVSQGFDPRFPVLSGAGESALKNLVMASGTLILLSGKTKSPEKTSDKTKA